MTVLYIQPTPGNNNDELKKTFGHFSKDHFSPELHGHGYPPMSIEYQYTAENFTDVCDDLREQLKEQKVEAPVYFSNRHGLEILAGDLYDPNPLPDLTEEEQKPEVEVTTMDKNKLKTILATRFLEDDLITLCFNVDASDFAQIQGANQKIRVDRLVQYYEDRNLLAELEKEARKLIPNVFK